MNRWQEWIEQKVEAASPGDQLAFLAGFHGAHASAVWLIVWLFTGSAFWGAVGAGMLLFLCIARFVVLVAIRVRERRLR
ncbi:MAG: hypothetical protein H0U76_21920 [Ktedonobacteraceae bacterium]|nr:hypothetical protein [Ktedonobacteraceae bacterium]